MFLVYNSDILADDDFRITVTDRAFQYGDGLFETLRYENGTLWFWNDHMDRLMAGIAALYLAPPPGFDAEALRQTVLNLLSANALTTQPVRIKIQVWRQAGGLYTPSQTAINYLITTQPTRPFSITEQAKIGIYATFRLTHSPISCYKTLNALPYVMAGIYKQERGFDDVALLNTEGYLAECVASNLFWFRDEMLYTPSLQTGCVNGIARRQLLRTFTDVREGLFTPDTLADADAVFAANVMGIQVFQGVLTNPQFNTIMPLFTGATPA